MELQSLKCQAREFRFYFVDSQVFEKSNDVIKVRVALEVVCVDG